MQDLNKILKIIYQQHAGGFNIAELRERQQLIELEKKNIQKKFQSNTIILNDDFFLFKPTLDQIEEKIKTLLKKKTVGGQEIKTKAERTIYLDRFKSEKYAILKEPRYINSYRDITPEEKLEKRESIKLRIFELEKEKSLNEIKILAEEKKGDKSEKFNIIFEKQLKNNIENDILILFNQYIINSLRNNKIKNPKELKKEIMIFKALYKYKNLSPLIKTLTDEKISDRTIIEVMSQKSTVDLESFVLDIEENIKAYFKIKTNIIEFDEIFTNYNLQLFQLHNFYDSKDEIKELYSMENLIIDLIDKPIDDLFKQYKSMDKTLEQIVDKFYHDSIKAILNENKMINKESIIIFHKNLNKLKLNLYFNIKTIEDLKDKISYNIVNFDDSLQLFNYLKSNLNLNLLEELTFLKNINFFRSKVSEQKLIDYINFVINSFNQPDLVHVEFLQLTNFPISFNELYDYYHEELKGTEYFEYFEKLYLKTNDYRPIILKYLDSLINIFIDFLIIIHQVEGVDLDDFYSEHQDMYSDKKKYYLDNTFELNFFKNVNESNTAPDQVFSMSHINTSITRLFGFVEDLPPQIFESENVKIYHLRSEIQSKKYGKDTHWCTAADQNNMFCHYFKPKYHNLFIIQPIKKERLSFYSDDRWEDNNKLKCYKKDERNEPIRDESGKFVKKSEKFLKFQLDTNPDSMEEMHLMDQCDDPVKICDLLREYSEIKNLLKYIPFYHHSNKC